MKITVDFKKEYHLVPADLLVVPIFEGDAALLEDLDKRLSGNLKQELVQSGFSSELGEKLWLGGSGKVKARKVCLLGLGDKDSINTEVLRRWGGLALQAARSAKASLVAAVMPYANGTENGIGALAEGLWLADYRFEEYLSDDRKARHKIEEVILIHDREVAQAEKDAAEAAINVLGTTFARDLVNRPSNVMTPACLAQTALDLSEDGDLLESHVFDSEFLQKHNFGGLLAVSQGSEEAPYLIHMVCRGSANPRRKITLVGKGITFDSGGLSLKSSSAISDMKADMAGAAAVLGVMRALKLMNLPLEVHGIIPTCENMPSGKAVRPGDVITIYGGKTVEVADTDAEGRLILADALSYASQVVQPDAMIDLATLTGAAMVALGEQVAALMTKDEDLALALAQAAEEAGEDLWRLPLVEDYNKQLKSDIADLTNVTDSRFAGAITGGLFLQNFADERIPYAHIDIAGPAWNKKGLKSYCPKGATGYGVRTLLAWLKTL